MKGSQYFSCHFTRFTDFDECNDGPGCKNNAACQNYVGDYNCTCNNGFENSEDGGPKDHDCVGK